MTVFLSWSGKVSQQVALVLRKWLPYMLHSIKPFMSTVDIRKGEKWSDDLTHELKGADYGIVCVTPFNMHKPWMNFESGALAHLPTLMPFLFRVDRAALGHSPLSQFQLTEFGPDDERNKTEFFRLIDGINDSVSEHDRLAPDVLTNNFDHWWSEVKKELDAIPETSPGETRTAYKWLRATGNSQASPPGPSGLSLLQAGRVREAGDIGLRHRGIIRIRRRQYQRVRPNSDCRR